MLVAVIVSCKVSEFVIIHLLLYRVTSFGVKNHSGVARLLDAIYIYILGYHKQPMMNCIYLLSLVCTLMPLNQMQMTPETLLFTSFSQRQHVNTVQHRLLVVTNKRHNF
jgi:hypothetical protein